MRMITFFALSIASFGANAAIGEAILKVMPTVDLVQKSNYGKNSFQLFNTGEKNIVELKIDASKAIFPGMVFDPYGLAGDSAAKPLQIDTDGRTGVVINNPYIGQGGKKGFNGLRLTFNTKKNRGFNPGESVGFSVDMDPNSIAGTRKSDIDGDSSPKWDVGGVSGAELIGATFTVTFADGTSASGQLFSTATQAGSQGFASQTRQGPQVQLTVNGLKPGQVGKYSNGGPRIVVSGASGKRVRVVVAKGFIQPVKAYNNALLAQLDRLSKTNFPANNAVEFQFFDVDMRGRSVDITDKFNFARVKDYDFSADPAKPFSVDENKVSLAVVAAVIDPQNKDMPAGPVTKPIYLNFNKGSSNNSN